jgi:hypothetical protein
MIRFHIYVLAWCRRRTEKFEGITDACRIFTRIRTNKISPRIHFREFLTPIPLYGSTAVVISTAALRPRLEPYLICAMRHWKLALRELSAEAHLHLYARWLSGRAGRGLHKAAIYGAFAVLAAVVFGTLSVHPF